ncbi:hypothetical protein NDU88_001957 [Pleurodeles waltl]|uniref:Uncharacterized protein n=1 Tax=Pleurodeles waltl TaxID=8319 RepID=A0AAV7U8A9_PLEWA|nr:hypothetical protein NDU88_001957 [Pleurodeles waltl]
MFRFVMLFSPLVVKVSEPLVFLDGWREGPHLHETLVFSRPRAAAAASSLFCRSCHFGLQQPQSGVNQLCLSAKPTQWCYLKKARHKLKKKNLEAPPPPMSSPIKLKCLQIPDRRINVAVPVSETDAGRGASSVVKISKRCHTQLSSPLNLTRFQVSDRRHNVAVPVSETDTVIVAEEVKTAADNTLRAAQSAEPVTGTTRSAVPDKRRKLLCFSSPH